MTKSDTSNMGMLPSQLPGATLLLLPRSTKCCMSLSEDSNHGKNASDSDLVILILSSNFIALESPQSVVLEGGHRKDPRSNTVYSKTSPFLLQHHDW